MSFYTEVLQKDPRFNSPSACHDLNMLEPGFRSDIILFINEAKAMGHTLVPVETYRSTQRQQMFYAKHLTKLRNVGVHHFGLACDLALMDGGHYQPDRQDYMFFLELAQKHHMISGIDWGTPHQHHTFHDYDHVQRIKVSDQAKLFAGEWYPESDYNPWA